MYNMYSNNIKLLNEVFVISRIIKADNPYLDLDYSGYHKKPNLIIVFIIY